MFGMDMVQSTLMQYGVRHTTYSNGKVWIQRTLTDFWPHLFESTEL